MHPVLVADIGRKVYPLDQGHIAADGFDIVEEFRVVWGTPWAITEGNTLLSIEINGGARSDAENGTACRTVRGEADVIWDAHPAIRTGRMPVSRHNSRNRSRNICRQQLIAAALAHRVEIVIASFLQNIL